MEKTKELVVSSFKLERAGVEAIGTPSFEQWLACGAFIKNCQGAVHFWIGDWLNYGEEVYGEVYAQALDETGYDYDTLRHDKWVASRVAKCRRRHNLSFSHHAEVADLTEEEQELLLLKAQTEQLTRESFRKIVRRYKGQKLEETKSPDEVQKEKDFEKVEILVGLSLQLREGVNEVKFDKLNGDARDFLFSELKKTVSALAKLLLGYETK